MEHMLARLKGVKFEEINKTLKHDAPMHAKEGLYLTYIWQNVDDPDEVLFLFLVDSIPDAKKFIDSQHSQALKENPKANLPAVTFLQEKST